MLTMTEEGFIRFSHESRQDGIHILLQVLFEFEESNWDFSPQYFLDSHGHLQKEKYVLVDPEGLELLRRISSVDELVEAFPRMHEREFGADAARAFPITRELIQEALDAGFIALY